MASSLVSPLRELHCPLCSLVIAVLVDNFQMALLKGLEKVKLEVPHMGRGWGWRDSVPGVGAREETLRELRPFI